MCLGDSITIGSRSYLGYPEYCGAFLSVETSKKWNVLNHAVAGYTTIDLSRSVDREFANLKDARPEIATILIGTNDLKIQTSARLFRMAYEQLITKVRLVVGNTNVVLIEIPLLMNNVMLPYNIGMNKMVSDYNEIIGQLAYENSLGLLKLNYDESCFYDGVHLNENGSEMIGKQLSDFVLKSRRIS